MLAAFVGCAGVGKNTIIKELIARYPEKYSIFPTLTTRAMRPGEQEGDPYHFVSRQAFEQLIDEGEIYEWQQIHDGSYYGGSRKVLRHHLATGKTLIKDIDVLGARTYKERLSDLTKILSVFLYVDDLNILLERMRARGDTEDNIKKRAERFQMEMELSVGCDYMVSNERVRDTTDIIDCLLRNEEQRGGVYLPCAEEWVPTEHEIGDEIKRIEAGHTPEAIELVYNGNQLLIKCGAARYAAAMRTGTFIQKVIRTLTDTSQKSALIDFEDWRKMLA